MSETDSTNNTDIEKQRAYDERKVQKFKESDAGDGTLRQEQIIRSKKKCYMCILSLCLCMFLIALDQMITTTVLTTISDHFKEFDKMTWITAAYMMSMGCFAQFWGRISINFGRKWVLVIGMVIFELGSLICGVSTSMNMLIAGRAIQGVGSSCIESLVMIIATEISSIDTRPVIFAIMGLTFVFSSVLGPIFGGVFGTYASWRWCFYLNLCCSAVIFPLFIFTYYPKPPTAPFWERVRTIDFLDNFLLVASFFLLLLGISFGQTESSWKSAPVICSFTIGGVLLVAFCIWNFKYSKYPTIPRKVFFNKNILICIGIFISGFSCMMISLQFLSVYFQNVAGHNSFHTGISLFPVAIASCIASIVSSVLTQKFLYIKIYALISGFLLPIPLALCTLFKSKENLGMSIGFQIMIGVFSGINFQGPMMTALLFAPKEPGSTILTTAMMNFARSVGIAFWSNIAGEVYSVSLKHGFAKIQPLLQDKNYPLNKILGQMQLISELNPHDQNLVKDKMTVGIRNIFWLCFGISIFSMFITLFMSNRKLPRKDEVDEHQRTS